MTVTAGRFGDRRDARQTLLEALDEASELSSVIVIKVRKPNADGTAVSVSWSDALSKIELLGLCSLADHKIREHEA